MIAVCVSSFTYQPHQGPRRAQPLCKKPGSASVAEVSLYVHRHRRFIRDGSPGRPPPLSHSWTSACEPVWPSGKAG